MRYAIFLITLFSACGLCAGTYQDKAGNRIPLKTKDGNDHPFNGHLAPFSNQQNVDLSDADFSPIPRIKKQGIKADHRLTQMHSQLTFMRNRVQTLHKSEAKLNKRGAEIDRQIKALRNKQDEPDKVKAQLTMLHNQRRAVFARIKTNTRKTHNIHAREKQIEQIKTAIALAEGAAADLRGVNLRGANLANANLDYALLKGADLSEAKLESANLDGAKMAESNLAKANLTGASLVATELSDANLLEVKLESANLNGAKLAEANLAKANLTGASLVATELSGANLLEVKLESANLNGAKLAEANLAKANLTGASLVATELSDANLRNVEFGAANLNDATLRRAYLRGAGIYAADFTNTDLTGAVLRDIDGWDEAVWTKAYYQATDSPWWPEGMDPKKLEIRKVKRDADATLDETSK